MEQKKDDSCRIQKLSFPKIMFFLILHFCGVSSEINTKLKKEIEEKLQREFNLLLEKKLLELNSEDTGSGVLSGTGKIKK